LQGVCDISQQATRHVAPILSLAEIVGISDEWRTCGFDTRREIDTTVVFRCAQRQFMSVYGAEQPIITVWAYSGRGGGDRSWQNREPTGPLMLPFARNTT
jgi:hypothetical protein